MIELNLTIKIQMETWIILTIQKIKNTKIKIAKVRVEKTRLSLIQKIMK